MLLIPCSLPPQFYASFLLLTWMSGEVLNWECRWRRGEDERDVDMGRTRLHGHRKIKEERSPEIFRGVTNDQTVIN